MAQQQEGTLQDLKFDDKNANRHTARGMGALENSIQRLGLGRSIVVDKDNRIIAGNATAEQAGSTGAAQKVVFVETDGDTLVAVRRRDLSLDDPRARELALADNRVSELNLDWDATALESMAEQGVDLSLHFTDWELEAINGQAIPPGDESDPGGDADPGDGSASSFTVECGAAYTQELTTMVQSYCDAHSIAVAIKQ